MTRNRSLDMYIRRYWSRALIYIKRSVTESDTKVSELPFFYSNFFFEIDPRTLNESV